MFTLNSPTKTEDLSGYVVYSHPCPNCSKVIGVEISSQQLYAYNQGAMAQDVLFDQPAVIRERFITGYCGKCWDSMFNNE